MNPKNNLIFCTLFDSNYLDKGLALYCSMKKQIKNFRLYIFAFDDRCYEILSDMCLKNVVIVSLSEIMNDRLQEIGRERNRAEFCWTCTPVVIEHVLVHYQERICTYIDADIYFFANPQKAIAKIEQQGCSVGLAPHRFERDYQSVYTMFRCGKYCIQFNTFCNDKEGLAVLRDWKNDCLEWCYHRSEDGKFGDQKYPDTWKMKYSCVYEAEDLGIGVAPWNLHLYSCVGKSDAGILMRYRGEEFPLIFYHFEGMRYFKDKSIFLNLWEYSDWRTKRKVRLIYGEYFHVLRVIRRKLKEQYGLSFEHMEVDKEEFLGKNYTLGKYCRDCGLARGVKAWAGFQSNDIIRV